MVPKIQLIAEVLKALREAIAFLRETKQGLGVVSEAIQRSKGKRTASRLDVLVFRTDESRHHLEQIAAGKGQANDFEVIRNILGKTAGRVEEAIDRLMKGRDFIRERYGMAIANRMDEILKSAQGGKNSIRFDLEMLARTDDKFYSSKYVAKEAKRILQDINSLNLHLEGLHDLFVEVKPNNNPFVEVQAKGYKKGVKRRVYKTPSGKKKQLSKSVNSTYQKLQTTKPRPFKK